MQTPILINGLPQDGLTRRAFTAVVAGESEDTFHLLPQVGLGKTPATTIVVPKTSFFALELITLGQNVFVEQRGDRVNRVVVGKKVAMQEGPVLAL